MGRTKDRGAALKGKAAKAPLIATGEEVKTVKVVLAGNPNAGKTTLFNALTHSSLKTGNWHGVTTSPAEKTVGCITYIDVPGMYSFNAYTMEEVSAAESVRQADVIINVVDSLTLENALKLTKRLRQLNDRVVVYLTKTKKLKGRGGWINAEKLQGVLGLPVFDCPPKQLKKLVEEGGIDFNVKQSETALDKAYYGGNYDLKGAEKLFYNKYFALFFFAAAMVFTFFFTFYPYMPGALLKDWTEALICDKFAGALAGIIENDVLRSFVFDGLIGGAGGVLAFVPQLTVLYLLLILLDESGIMSALSFVTDGIFEKVNLSGRAAFSLVSGFGCTAAAIATTRGYSDVSAQRRTIAVLPYIPCGAKLPVFLTFLSPIFKNPFPAICAMYFAGLALSVLISAILRGKKEGLITEIAPISMPDFTAVKNKLFFYVKGFIIKVATFVTLFCTVSWILSHFNFAFEYVPVEESALCGISKLLVPLFYPMGITDWRLAYAAVTGFVAKENVAATVAMLFPEGLAIGFAPSLAMCAFILTCPACVSAFGASVKEIGFKRTLKYNLLQLAVAFGAAYLINLIFILL